ncbi:MAG: gliding motility-associated C-terminal domain-containing protein [Bacteroidetes bacterium]|nr:gliding motility-associated C-terminal domain-containing protein [Bacteroidota bacterium]
MLRQQQQEINTLKITSALGCTASAVTNVLINALPTITVNSPSVCPGVGATLNAGGASTYTWFPGNIVGSSASFTPVATTVYTVIGTSAGGCTAQTTATITVNPLPVPLPTSNSPICTGGLIILNVNAFTTYTWTGPNAFSSNLQNPTIANASTVHTGNYTVTVTSVLGCTASAVTNVIVNPTPTIAVGNTGPYCAGATINLTVTAANTYTWTGPNAFNSNLQNPTIANSTTTMAGPYVVTVTAVGGCKSTGTTVVVVNPLPTPTITATSPVCVGKPINFTALGGTSYTWTGPNAYSVVAQNATIPSAILANAGNYTLTLTNGFGCTNTAVVNVVVNPLPVIVVNSPTVCVGSSFTLTATGGTAYAWSGPNVYNSALQNPPFASASMSLSGNYTVMVTGPQGCTNTAVASLSVVTLPTVSIVGTNTLCSQNFNGSPNTITLTATGAANFTWTLPGGFSGAPNLNTSPLVITPPVTAVQSVASISVFGTAGSCTSSAVYNVTVYPNPTITVNSASMCAGTSVTLTANNASTYTWSPATNLNTTSGPVVIANPANTTVYSIIGSSLGCNSQTQNSTVTVVPNPTVTITPINPAICLGNSITLTAAGANTYTWSPNIALTSTNTTITVSNPTATITYSVLGSAATCTNLATITVSVLGLPSVTVTPSSPTLCMNNFNGSPNTVSLTASGAASYTWGPIVGVTTNTLNGPLVIGTSNGAPVVTGTVIGANGTCTNLATFTVNAIPNPTIATTSGSMCAGTSVTLSASNATSYTWSPATNLNTTTGPIVIASPSVTTVYSVFGSSVGCNSQSQNATASVVPNPTVTITPLNPAICLGNTITLTAAGANTYTWSPNIALSSTNTAITNASPTITTTYSILGSAATCTNLATITVSVLGLPSVTVTPSSPTLCMNNFNGSPNTVSLTASGAASYTWGPIVGVTTNTLNGPLVIGTSNGAPVVTGTVIGANGTCTNVATFTVNAIPNPTIATTSGSMCAGTSVTLSAMNATSYTWSPATTLSSANGPIVTASPSVTTVYSVFGSSVGCNSQSQNATASVVVNPTVTVVPNNPVICLNNSITLTASGANTYTWSPNIALTSTNTAITIASPTTNTTYSILGSAATCTNLATITVTVLGLPSITVTPSSPTLCMNNFNGSPNTVSLTASGAASYTWGPIIGVTTNTLNGPLVIGTSNGAPVVTGSVIGANGTCTNISTFTVNAIPNPIIGTTSGSMCAGTSVTLSAMNATSYTWSPATTLSSANGPIVTASPSVTTVYSVFGSSVGCNSQSQNATASVVANPTVNIAPLTPTICFGNSINLTASGATNYSWSPNTAISSTVGNNVTVNPTVTTVYTLIGEQTTCTNVAVTTVTVVPLPIININLSNGMLCMNNFNNSTNTIGISASGANSYNWTGFTGLTVNATNAANIIGTAVPPNLVGTGTVVGTVGTCSNTASFSIMIVPNPTLTVSSASMCFGTSANLNANGATSYTWSPSNTLNTANGNAVIASPSVNTIYSIVGTSLLCNSPTETATVIVVANPVIGVAPGVPTICAGSAIGLTAFGANNYTWSPASSLSSSTGNIVSATPLVTTNYTVIGEASTCTTSIVKQVLVTPLPQLQAVCDRTAICLGEKTGINANGATSYTWIPTYGLTSGNSNFVIADPAQSTVYSLIGNNGLCTATITIPINVITRPVLNLTTNSPKICVGNKSTIFASGAMAYRWTPPVADSLNHPNMAIITPTATMNYTVMGYNFSGTTGCVFTKEIEVEVVQTITATATKSVEVCKGQSVKLNAGGSNTYVWGPSKGLSNAFIAQPYASPDVTTVYTVQVSNGGNCGGTATVLVKVNPIPDVNAGEDMTYNLDQPMYLNAKGTGTLTWILGEGILCKDCPNSQIMPQNSGCYQIMAVDAGGCKAIDEVCIEVTKEHAIYVPNIFTPNYDGLNDVFLVYGTGLTKVEMYIFDRWGEKLFYSNEQLKGWDGNIKDEEGKQDVYTYLINYTTFDNKKHTKTGHVTLLR